MTSLKNAKRGRVLEVIAKYGKCMELISMDPNFHEITVGLYFKDGTGTVWTFSGRPGVEKRVEEIRDQLVGLGDMVPVEGTHNQARFPDGEVYVRPLRFLLRQAVEKPFGTRHPDGRIEIKDLRSPLQVIATPEQAEGRWISLFDGEPLVSSASAMLEKVDLSTQRCPGVRNSRPKASIRTGQNACPGGSHRDSSRSWPTARWRARRVDVETEFTSPGD